MKRQISLKSLVFRKKSNSHFAGCDMPYSHGFLILVEIKK